MPLILRSQWPALLLALTVARAPAQISAVTLTPPIVVAGAPELIRLDAPDAVAVKGEWLGRTIDFFRSRNGRAWFALAGVDVEAPVGPSHLEISVQADRGAVRTITRDVPILPAHYRIAALTVEPKFVEPGPEALAEIHAQEEIKKKVFAASTAEPLWRGSFRAPVHSAPTDSFGTRRMFNGKLASIHKGADFRAATGTVVRAGNSGVVVLARPLYYEGNCVVIDHGLGLFTLSMHLSRIDVSEGQHVETGTPIGLSGATGRVTGPHLHWAVRWQGAYLDPVKLLRMNLDAAR